MKLENIFLMIIILSLLPVLSFSQTNPKWLSAEITMSPANPGAGDTLRFSATFRIARDPVANLVVVGGVDGTELFCETYPRLAKSQDTEVSFTWTATSGNHTVYMQIDPDNLINEYMETDNRLTKRFTVPLGEINLKIDKTTPGADKLKVPTSVRTIIGSRKPDLTIWQITNTPVIPFVGEEVAIEIVVKNTGKSTAPTSTAELKIGKYGSPPPSGENVSVGILAQNGVYTIEKRMRFESGGTYILSAEVDSTKIIDELKEDNNLKAHIFTVNDAKPDLIILDITKSLSTSGPLPSQIITVTVKNNGPGAAGPFNVFLACSSGGGLPWSDTLPVSAMGNGQQKDVKKSVSYLMMVTKCDAFADFSKVIDESDETNNSLTVEF